MSDAKSYKDMKVKDLKEIIKDLPDEMLVIMPVIDEGDVNQIYGFRKIRTAGILNCDSEEDQERDALCLNAAAYRQDIADQVHFSGRDVFVKEVLYGESKFDSMTFICVGAFSTIIEARSILYNAKEIATTYGYVTMADIHDLCGRDTVYGQTRVGWTLDAFKYSKIRETEAGRYEVFLPEFDWYKDCKVTATEPKLYLKRRK